MTTQESGSRSAADVVDDGHTLTRDPAAPPPPGRDQLKAMHRRQRDEFGGLHWGCAFFGWLVAVGIAALLTALLSAAGAAVGLTQASAKDAASNADTIGIAGGIVLLAILVVAYSAGGYVAGRMARFSGPKQGLG